MLEEPIKESVNPWFITAIVSLIGAIGLFAEKLGIKGLILGKANANKDCQKRIIKLEFVIVKLVSVIKTTSAFMNNPENAEQSRLSIEEAMAEIADLVEEIENNNKITNGGKK